MASWAICAFNIFRNTEYVSDQHENTRNVHDTQVSDPMNSMMDRDRCGSGVDASVENESHNDEVSEDDELEYQANHCHCAASLLC